MKKIILIENPLEYKWTTHEVDHVGHFLRDYFHTWPSGAHVYNRQVAVENDITPYDEQSIAHLEEVEDLIYVVVYPEGTLVVIAIVAVVAAIAAAYFFKPQVPNPAIRNAGSSSPNNELADRQNTARVNGRIPDIYGTVRSIPDLIAVPYREFVSNQEVEHALMCVGRGSFDISDVRDGATPVADIPGMSVEIFGPNSSPNNSVPLTRYGQPITNPFIAAKRYSAVNGQTLRPPNAFSVTSITSWMGIAPRFRFVSPNKIELLDPWKYTDLSSLFVVGDSIVVAGPVGGTEVAVRRANVAVRVFKTGQLVFATPPPGGLLNKSILLEGSSFSWQDSQGHTRTTDLTGEYWVTSVNVDGVTIGSKGYESGSFIEFNQLYPNTYIDLTLSLTYATNFATIDLGGTYSIAAIDFSSITLTNPAGINTAWNTLASNGGFTAYVAGSITCSGPRWVGPFFLDDVSATRIAANFVAQSGLYRDTGTERFVINVDLEMELTPVDASGNPTAAAQLFPILLTGSIQDQGLRGVTLVAAPNVSGRQKVRVRRITLHDTTSGGTVVDEVKWRDVYSYAPITQSDFGGVTTIRTKTYATTGSLAVKERKLNLLAARKLPQRISGSTFTSTLYATKYADEIISAICLDQKIGNRSVTEVDFDNIYTTMDQIASYFGTFHATEFSYTFDKDNLSFEEILSTVASVIFCTAYRRGNQIRLTFEKSTPDSTLLFNHRNKIPGTETRTVRFGLMNDQDGVELSWVDPVDDAIVTFYVPEDKSAINPQKIESIGIRTKIQARFHAYRAFNKMTYQNTLVEFEATQEADVLLLMDRILNADNTRPETQDGEVIAQNGLILTLSQDVSLVGGTWQIFLQHRDGTVESIAITPGAQANQVVLGATPRLTLVTDRDSYARTTYIIVGSTDTQKRAFLVSERESKSNFTSMVHAINYDDRYYTNDLDVINNVVNEEGN